jgi:hypothetical protein
MDERKPVQVALLEGVRVGFGGGGGGYIAPAEPPADRKTAAEMELENDLATGKAQSAAMRTGRESTILTKGMKGLPAETKKSGLLSYESMTGMEKNTGKIKLGA